MSVNRGDILEVEINGVECQAKVIHKCGESSVEAELIDGPRDGDFIVVMLKEEE